MDIDFSQSKLPMDQKGRGVVPNVLHVLGHVRWIRLHKTEKISDFCLLDTAKHENVTFGLENYGIYPVKSAQDAGREYYLSIPMSVSRSLSEGSLPCGGS